MLHPLLYRIHVRAHLHQGWSDWFDGMAIECAPDDTTVLVGPVIDQAALHGLLAKVRDLGPVLLSVESCEIDDV
jgi:hypothetical protein